MAQWPSDILRQTTILFCLPVLPLIIDNMWPKNGEHNGKANPIPKNTLEWSRICWALQGDKQHNATNVHLRLNTTENSLNFISDEVTPLKRATSRFTRWWRFFRSLLLWSFTNLEQATPHLTWQYQLQKIQVLKKKKKTHNNNVW